MARSLESLPGMSLRASRAATAAVIGALAWAAAGSARADDPDATFTVNPFDLSAGIINFEYEGALGPFLSLHMGLDFLVFDDDVMAVGPRMGARLFLFGGAPGGLWAGPFGGVAYVRGDNAAGEEGQDIGAYAGGMVGYTLIPFDILVLSAGAGLAYHELDVQTDGGEVGLDGVHPRFRLAIGLAF